MQFLADSLKIFFKDYFSILHNKKFLFFLIPLLFLFFNFLTLFNFIYSNNIFLIDIELNFIYFLIFSFISNILIFLTGYFCKNKYTLLTSSRNISIFFINELLFTIIMCHLFYLSKSFSFSDYLLFASGIGEQGGNIAPILNNSSNNGGVLVNSARKIIYASEGIDYAEKAKIAAIEYNDLLQGAVPKIESFSHTF